MPLGDFQGQGGLGGGGGQNALLQLLNGIFGGQGQFGTGPSQVPGMTDTERAQFATPNAPGLASFVPGLGSKEPWLRNPTMGATAGAYDISQLRPWGTSGALALPGIEDSFLNADSLLEYAQAGHPTAIGALSSLQQRFGGRDLAHQSTIQDALNYGVNPADLQRLLGFTPGPVGRPVPGAPVAGPGGIRTQPGGVAVGGDGRRGDPASIMNGMPDPTISAGTNIGIPEIPPNPFEKNPFALKTRGGGY